MDNKIKRLVYLSLLAALCCVATMTIPIPTPTGGYLNAGDMIVVFTALLAGPVWGGVSMGIGSMLADVFVGYAVYAPGTLLAKGLAAVVTGLLYRKTRKPIVSAVCGEFVMAALYFFYESLALGYGLAASAEIVGNLLQGAVGVAGGTALWHALRKVPEIQEFEQSLE
ncbi:MAG: ECF transporter S component [Oscillospiraceae bacterium]|nr:ECF transporter S component [Oscillospiraceae bacterium]MBQ6402391.1 ECF transporter S component [Oscillospiraceae bacterium]